MILFLRIFIISIKNYLEGHSKMTAHRIAKESGVSETTLRRVIAGELSSMPNGIFAMKVLFFIHKITRVRELVDIYKDDLREFLIKELSFVEMSSEELDYVQKLQSIVADPIVFHVIALAGTNIGVDEKTIEEYFGTEGLTKLMFLFNEDYLVLKQGRFHGTQKGVAFQKHIFKDIAKVSTDLIDTDSSSAKSRNFFYHWTEALNDKGIDKVMSLEREHYGNLQMVIKDKKYLGDQHIFFFGAFDSYKKNGLGKK